MYLYKIYTIIMATSPSLRGLACTGVAYVCCCGRNCDFYLCTFDITQKHGLVSRHVDGDRYEAAAAISTATAAVAAIAVAVVVAIVAAAATEEQEEWRLRRRNDAERTKRDAGSQQ